MDLEDFKENTEFMLQKKTQMLYTNFPQLDRELVVKTINLFNNLDLTQDLFKNCFWKYFIDGE